MAKDIDPKVWAAAKADRDAAIEAAYAVENPDERVAALEAARDAWTKRKAALLKGR